MLNDADAKPLLEDVGAQTLNRFVKTLSRVYNLPTIAATCLRREKKICLRQGDQDMLIEILLEKPEVIATTTTDPVAQ